MNTEADRMHRTDKALVDAGLAASFEEAAHARNRRVTICVTKAEDAGYQAAALTAVATARRAFGNRISIEIRPGIPTLGCGYGPQMLDAALAHLVGVNYQDEPEVMMHIGCSADCGRPRNVDHVWLSLDGWSFTVGPAPVPNAGLASPFFVGVAAGAQLVAEAFLSMSLGHPAAGRRPLQRSLWSPEVPSDIGPSKRELARPSELWLVGLGHLGQGVAWTLMCEARTSGLQGRLMLQDFDHLVPANVSTGLLTQPMEIDQLKTRSAAAALERSGFETQIVERRLDRTTQRTNTDPAVLVTSVDDHRVRRLITGIGASLAIDLALGAESHNFMSMVMRTFPDSGPSESVSGWLRAPRALDPNGLSHAYRTLAADECGQLQLAGRAVGASFVGAFAGALLLAELVRRSSHGPAYRRLDIDLRSSSCSDQTPFRTRSPRPRWALSTVSV